MTVNCVRRQRYSTLDNLAGINQLDFIRQLYDTVIIPKAVYRELIALEFLVAGVIEVQPSDRIQIC